MNDNGKVKMTLVQKFELGNESLNQKLSDLVLEEINQEMGLNKEARHSNIGGWHSKRDLHAKLGNGTVSGDLLLQLFASFSAAMMEYIKASGLGNTIQLIGTDYDWDYTGAWFNVAFQGSYNAPHTHPGSQISAAYYIRNEDSPKEHPFSGRIDFIHENLTTSFFPKAGDLILFPSDMLHWVHPYYGSGLRICLSFNATHVRAAPA
jgi:uncharacterized protein (TIGR02466 family)